MTTGDDTNATPTSSPGRLPTSTLLVGGGGLLLVLGAFLPWVKVFAFGISGIDADWGIFTLIIGLVALAAAFGAGRIFDASKTDMLIKVTAGLGVVAVAIAVYVGFAIRDAVAEDEATADTSTSQDEDLGEFGEGFEDAFEDLAEALKPTTGIGVYATLVGGVLIAAGGLMGTRRGGAA